MSKEAGSECFDLGAWVSKSRYPQNRLSDHEAIVSPEIKQVDATGGDVLAQLPGRNLETQVGHLFE